MNNLSLTACSFTFRVPHKKTGYYNLNDDVVVDIDDSITTTKVKEMFTSFFNAYSSIEDDSGKMKTFRCVFSSGNIGDEKAFTYLFAKVHSGGYGSAFDIVDVKTKKVEYKANAGQAAERPFYVCIIIPKDSDKVKVQKGMLFFQNTGAYGVKTITSDFMNIFFKETYNLKITCKTIASQVFVDRILTKENMRQIKMTRNHKSSDTADMFSKGYGVETRVLGNLNLFDQFWDKLKKGIDHFCNGKFNLFEFDNVDYNVLKVIVEIGGRPRTVNLNNIENLSIIEAIPDDIKLADGSPHEKRLIDHFIKVANEYLCEMVLQIEK